MKRKVYITFALQDGKNDEKNHNFIAGMVGM